MRRKYRNAGAFGSICGALLCMDCTSSALAKSRTPVGARLWPARLPGLPFVIALLVAINVAHADPLSTLNALRTEGCAGAAPAGSTVIPSEPLNGVARELSSSGQLSDAIERTGYPAGNSVAVYLRGRTDDAAIRLIIEDDYCSAINDPQLNEVGIYRSGDEIWMVLAARMELPAVEDAAAVEARVLELVNTARANTRQCGNRKFDAVAPLRLSPVLTEVALFHAQDMAQQGSMDHRGSDGSQPSERVARTGYRYRAAGENIAAGQPNADAVVAGWLDSPGHCTNIMAPQFTEMGVAFALASGNPTIYWAQVFAAPR